MLMSDEMLNAMFPSDFAISSALKASGSDTASVEAHLIAHLDEADRKMPEFLLAKEASLKEALNIARDNGPSAIVPAIDWAIEFYGEKEAQYAALLSEHQTFMRELESTPSPIQLALYRRVEDYYLARCELARDASWDMMILRAGVRGIEEVLPIGSISELRRMTESR